MLNLATGVTSQKEAPVKSLLIACAPMIMLTPSRIDINDVLIMLVPARSTLFSRDTELR
jgi:hypothetical protein